MPTVMQVIQLLVGICQIRAVHRYLNTVVHKIHMKSVRKYEKALSGNNFQQIAVLLWCVRGPDLRAASLNSHEDSVMRKLAGHNREYISNNILYNII